MLKYIFIILFLNAFTFFFWRKNRSGIVNQGIYRTEVNDATTYLIAGMLPQSDEPFSWLLDENCPIKGGVHVISYQNFGFDPRAAAAQIGRDIFERGRTAILITMSLGAEITMYLGEPAKHVAIDPCFGRQSLSRFNNLPAHIVTILLEIGVFVLGWLAYLPIIKSGSKRYSLALYADWLYWATIDFEIEDKLYLDGLITSTCDEIIDGRWLREHLEVNQDCRRNIPCGHADVENFGPVYVADLAAILPKITNFRIFGQ